MKRILIVVLCLLPMTAWGMNVGIVGGGSATVCTTPTSGTINEGFEGSTACGDGSHSNCENGWTVGGSPDFNISLPATPPTGCCTTGIRFNTSGSAITISKATTTHTDITVKAYFYVNTIGGTWRTIDLIGAYSSTATGNNVFAAYVKISGDGAKYEVLVDGTASVSIASNLTTGAYHLLECKVTKNATSQCRLDGGSDVNFTATNKDIEYVYVGAFRGFGAGMDVYMDNIHWTYTNGYF